MQLRKDSTLSIAVVQQIIIILSFCLLGVLRGVTQPRPTASPCLHSLFVPQTLECRSRMVGVDRFDVSWTEGARNPPSGVPGALLFAKATLGRRQTVFVCSVDADGAFIFILEEPEVGVVCRSLSSDTGTGTNEAWADVNGVGISRLHVNGWERWERSRSGLVVVGRLRARAASWVVTSEEEGATALDFEVGGLELRLQGEDEFEGAIGVRTVGWDVEAEDGGNVVGGEDTVVLRAERLVWLRLGNLGDVVREFELARCEVARAAFSRRQSAFAQDFSWVGHGDTRQDGESGEGLHADATWVSFRVDTRGCVCKNNIKKDK